MLSSDVKKTILRHATASVIFWVLLVFIFASANYLQALRAERSPDYWNLIRTYFVLYGSTALAAPIIFAAGKRQATLKHSALQQSVAITSWMILIYFIHVLYSIGVISPHLGITASAFFAQTSIFAWIWDFVMLVAILSCGYAYGYSERIHDGKIAEAELNSQLATIEAELASEQSNHLRQRLGSHFVLNALSNIIALVRKDQRDKAMDGLYLLSDILKSIAHQDDDSLCTLDQELAFLEKYLNFQTIRYPSLNVSWEIDADTRQLMLPGHILQPLVENAFKHGMNGGGTLTLSISANIKGENTHIQVSNSFSGEHNQTQRGEGQKLTKLRLQKHYGTNAVFSWEIVDNHYVAHIVVPKSNVT